MMFCRAEKEPSKASLVAHLETQPYDGSGEVARKVPTDYDALVAFVGKFADWKRLDSLLIAAAAYEKAFAAKGQKVVTVVAGTGPPAQVKRFQDIAKAEGCEEVFFVGPQTHPSLAKLYNAASVGCFPAFQEPMGLVFIECLACGTPVIGADSGGPRDFVSPAVGELVEETDDNRELGSRLADAIVRSIDEGWKEKRGDAGIALANAKYTLAVQTRNMLVEVEKRL